MLVCEFSHRETAGFWGDCACMRFSHREAAGFWRDCACKRIFAQRSSALMSGSDMFVCLFLQSPQMQLGSGPELNVALPAFAGGFQFSLVCLSPLPHRVAQIQGSILAVSWGDCAGMRNLAQRSSGVLGGLCLHENFRTEKQRGFGGTVLVREFSHREAAGFWGDCACMRILAQRSSGVLGGLCLHENFRTEKQRGFGGTVTV